MEILHTSKKFPKGEIYASTDQIRRSSRSVSSNLAEAFRKRRYEKLFVSKLTDAEGEAAETQVWSDYSLNCGYIDDNIHTDLYAKYEYIISMIVKMGLNPGNWSF